MLIITRVSARVGLMSDRRKKRMQMGTQPGIMFHIRLMLQATRMSKTRTKTARKTRRQQMKKATKKKKKKDQKTRAKTRNTCSIGTRL